MDGVSLANTKAQWDEALQSSLAAFRLLVSQPNAKAWKPILTPNQSSALNAGQAASSSARPIAATPNGSIAYRDSQQAQSRRASTVFSSSHEASASPIKGKTKDTTDQQRTLSSSSSISSLKQHASDAGTATPTSATFPSRDVPFLPNPIDPAAVKLHRRSGGKAVGLPSGVDVHRAVVDVPFEGVPDLEAFKSSLATPEARTKWDPMVDGAEAIELLDPHTQVAKTNFRLGWPASPRDAITISRTIHDTNTLIFVSTSLPRSVDAPAYLRPAPPFVRSHVHLFAWCVQFPDGNTTSSAQHHQQSVRITVFHAWDLRGAWLGMPPGGLATHLTSTLKGLIKFIRKGASALPSLKTWTPSIDVLNCAFDVTRDTLSTEYCVTAEDSTLKDAHARSLTGSDESQNILAHRRAAGSSIQFHLPAEEGWDVKMIVKAQFLEDDQSADWKASAFRLRHSSSSSSQVTLHFDHTPLQASDESVKAQVTIQRIAASSDIRLRVNDETYPIQDQDAPEPLFTPNQSLLNETASLSNISIHSTSNLEPQDSRHKPTDSISQFSTPKRNAAIGPIVRRNYIYFTSMLQEPDAKWKHLSENRGVTVTQLDSIDPTLVVYRAEATFVNVGVWDIFASISSPGTRAYWDKTLDEAKLLEDVGNVSTLWHTTTKAAWPVSARDSVEIETSYKSPSSVHIFSFSTDDRKLFPSIPSPATGTIRTQVDLRGWSVESLSPTTVHVTLIEQSDPKGWTSKSATPAAMIAAVAGVGEHAIKMGAPPVLTRILDATVSDLKYDYEKATFRLEYSRSDAQESEDSATTDAHNVECEVRCDLESWAANLDLVVDPPPINVSCLRRHKLSPGGGGLWITIEHVPASLEDDAARVTIRRGAVSPPGERGVVLVNGAKIKVDVDELKENEVAQLKDRKRGKPQRVPLDMRQKAQKDEAAKQGIVASANAATETSIPSTPVLSGAASVASVPSRVGSPAPPELASIPKTGTPFSDKQPKHAMTPALDVLFLLRRIYAERSPDPAVNPAGWALVTHRNGLYVRKKLMGSISPTVTVQRGDKVVQGVTAEDMIAAVSSLGCRGQWDDRVESSKILQSYGDGATASFFTTTGAFPFRGRGFYLASLTSRAAPPSSRLGDSLSSTSSGIGAQNVYYHAAASFPEQASQLDPGQVNPAALPIGKVLIDGWIFETLDPYSSTLNYQIPSTRCTHIVAIDYAGSLPLAVNTIWNANLPKSILAVENYVKSHGAVPSVRAPPSFVQVLGDGRDEDHDFVWSLAEGSTKRQASLMFSNFSASDRRLEILLQLKKQSKATVGASSSISHSSSTPSSSRFIRTPAVSNASTTKASAQTAISSTSSLSRSTSMQDALAESGNSILNGDSSSSKTATKATKTPSALLAPGFQGSLRAPRVSLRGSDIRPRGPQVVADIEVELKHFAAGYKVEVYSEFVPSKDKKLLNGSDAGEQDSLSKSKTAGALETANGSTKPSPSTPIALDTIAKSRKEVPVITAVYDLPPSAVLAATLDPSARPRRHLLRLTMPENADDADADAGPSGDGTPKVTWKDRLSSEEACIRVIVRPVKAEGQGSNPKGTSAPSNPTAASIDSKPEGKPTASPETDHEDIDSQQVPVYYGGQRMEVVHVNKTSSMLQREHSADPGVLVLQRIPRNVAKDSVEGGVADSSEDVIPRPLARPVAFASLLERKPEPPAASLPSQKLHEGGPDVRSQTDGESKARRSSVDASSAFKESQKQAEGARPGSADEKKDGPASSATASLMGLLQSYPLSRLGASTALSTVSATGEGARKRDGDKEGSESAQSGDAKSSDPTSTASQITSLLPNDAATLFGGRALHEARFSLATVFVVALICFLAGSLLRAMLSPADFIFFPPSSSHSVASSPGGPKAVASDVAGVAVGEIQRLLGGEQSEQVAWRKVLRLLEIKRAVAGRFDLVLAVVDRRL